MKPKTSRWTSNIATLGAVALLVVGVLTKQILWYVLGVAMAVIAFVVRLLFYHCPSCRRILPNTLLGIDNCPYCGEDLEE